VSCTTFGTKKRSEGKLCTDARRHRHLHCVWRGESMHGLPDELHHSQHKEEVRREVIHRGLLQGAVSRKGVHPAQHSHTINQSTNRPTDRPTDQSINQSIRITTGINRPITTGINRPYLGILRMFDDTTHSTLFWTTEWFK